MIQIVPYRPHWPIQFKQIATLLKDATHAWDTRAAKAYEVIKINLAKHFPDDVNAYYEIKDPVFDVLMAGAEIWASSVRWSHAQSDL
ncbi:hypothetical protein DYBT9623_01255 [Dyadobacter sp. CECT 9623]|uniref:Uncharacterized protein n=1 Tax=Dyadobacter linearis TaxID=2823330 RepID=A0ABN7R5E8_9BACT|nr:GrpB family protein [Dyadobacter sp. CECT 9623]CAG5068524.1 hypothetical protein DYBT9623_01255 [Dyadobacter sp. CECT 9623]